MIVVGREADDGKVAADRARRGRQARQAVRTDGRWLDADRAASAHQKRGGKWADHRRLLNGVFWVLNSGAQWRDMPERYGHWETVYGRYRRWTREGLFDKILNALHVSLDEDGRIDWSVSDVDGSNIRAHRSAAGASRASKETGPASPPTSPWGDPAEVLARSFIL